MTSRGQAETDPEWWRNAVVYQIYTRSFADGNGDGTGDLAGVRSRLPYLTELGVDALWFTPWYRSPQADGGYDVADYRAIDAMFGILDDAEGLIADARALGIRTIVDIVPNHVSSEHVWFQSALTAPPGAPERDRFWFRDGRGEHGEIPPNDWMSMFGGNSWTRTTTSDGTHGRDEHGAERGASAVRQLGDESAVPASVESLEPFGFERHVIQGKAVEGSAELAVENCFTHVDRG